MTERRAAPPDIVREVTRSKRFLAADRAALDLGEIATWDPYLLREHRLLVPIDVQALYVEPGNGERMVRLPMLVAGPGGNAVSNVEDGMPDPFVEGEPRPAGVHLHWAMPDALLRGAPFGHGCTSSRCRTTVAFHAVSEIVTLKASRS